MRMHEGRIEMRLAGKALCFTSAAPLALAVGFSAMTSAMAQTADEARTSGDIAELEEILVTGSYIRREGYSAPSPLQVIGRDEMGAQGATNITDIIKYVSANTGSEFNFDRTNQNFTFGTAQINLRGLGLGATLTLINGRRITRSAAVANDGSQFVDINTMPMNMIERIEILKDGASALYGTDAVAGVANIITRSRFDGFEVEGRYQTTTEDSQEDINLNVAFGAGNDKSHVAAFFTYFDRTDLRGIERDFFPTLLSPETNTGQGLPGTFFPAVSDGQGGYRVAPGAPGTPPGASGLPPPSAATGTGPVPDPRCLDQTGLGGAASFEVLGPGGATRAGIGVGDDIAVLPFNVRGFCSFNFAENFSLVPDESRKLLFVEATHKLTDDIELFAEFNYADNRATVDASPSLPNQFTPILVPANNPFIPTPAELGGINPVFHNPDGTPRPVFVQFRVKSRADGSSQMQVAGETWRVVAGARFELPADWHGEVHYQHSENSVSFTDNGATVFSLAEQALAGTLRGFEGIFLNPFASAILDRPTDPALEDAIIRTSERFTRAEQTTVEGFVSGNIVGVALPGGPLGLALGFSYRKDNFLLDNDDLLNIGDSFFQPASPDGFGSLDVFGVFGELSIPVLDTLEVQAAVRYEDYGGSVGSTVDPKISARWDALDWLSVRGSFGTSFRAPNVTQNAITEAGTQRINDPFFPGPGGLTCNVDANGNITAFRGSNSAFGREANPDLKPEDSTAFTIGFIVEPTSNIRASVDYWNFNYDDVIVLEDNQQIVLNDCLDDGIANDPRVVRLNSNVVNVTRAFFNAASVETDGIDLAVNYKYDLGDYGLIDANAEVTWVNNYDIDLGNGTKIEGVGSRNRTNPFRSVTEWRANFPVSWIWRNHMFNVTPRLIDGVTDDATGVRVGAETYFDLQYRINFEGLLGNEDVLSLTVGAVNVLNNKIQPLPGETFKFDAKLFDPRERMVYVRLNFRG
ncbi:MAG: TonB-dependent receptor [Rhodothalassiaceae bacterium]